MVTRFYLGMFGTAKEGIRMHVAVGAQCRLTARSERPTLNSICERNLGETLCTGEETVAGTRGPIRIPVVSGG